MELIQILMLCNEGDTLYPYPQDELAIDFCLSLDKTPEKRYDLVILNRTPEDSELSILSKMVKNYALLVTENVDLSQTAELFLQKGGRLIQESELFEFLQKDALLFFSRSYGEKYRMANLSVSRNFQGSVQWQGSYALKLQGSFGSSFCQAVFWRNDIPLERHQTIDFWLEYKKSDQVSISLQAVLMRRGSISEQIQHWEFSEEQLDQVISIRAEEAGFLFVSLFARGEGTLKIIALHDRYSRGPYGCFLPGGKRYVTCQREEIFAYFEPGNRKPPLNVYFSGYKTRQGFEGINIMRSLGHPFLLIAEARLEGGAYYMGSEEYEQLMENVIQEHLDELEFTPDQLILSGISMGSTGALYYGCRFRPHALIVGKPLAHLGTIAVNEALKRPGGYPTSLDVLMVHGGAATKEAAKELDDRFWKLFNSTDWSGTKLIVSYMLEDDYDGNAYNRMLECLSSQTARIYGRGLHGRHNDDTAGIVNWFINQYRAICSEDFEE